MADFDVVKLGAYIGARIDGVRLAGDLDAGIVAAINGALVEHKVIFFRDQHDLDDAGQLAFARKLGTPTTAHPTLSRGAAVLPIDSRYDKANSWHTDVTFVDRVRRLLCCGLFRYPATAGPPRGRQRRRPTSSCPRHCVRSPKTCGRYTPINTTTPRLRRPARGPGRHGARVPPTVRFDYYETEHPVVRVHPESGKRVLLLGHFVKQFVGLGAAESATLFGLLQARITKLENTIRWTWQPGDLAIWDNRATQHYAIADYDDQYRRLNRVTLAGDIPVDVHGQRSRAVVGDATQYSEVISPIPLAS